MMGGSSMRSRALAAAIVLVGGAVAAAQGPTYKLGRTPSPQELRPPDQEISPTGEELPPGSGTSKQGSVVYVVRGCAGCHGPTGVEGPAPHVVGPPAARTMPSGHDHEAMVRQPWPGRGVADMPFATMIWSWI